MRLTLRTTIAIAWAMLAPACSSLGGVELQDGEGRFTAGDDGDPTDPTGPSGGSHDPSDTGDGTSSGRDGDHDPLEPPQGTDDSDSGSSTSDADTDAPADTEATDGSASATDAEDESSGGGLDDGTTSLDPQSNGIDSASTTGDTAECTELECLPACDPTWPDVCGQPCDDVRDTAACVTQDGIVVSCDMGVWTCSG